MPAGRPLRRLLDMTGTNSASSGSGTLVSFIWMDGKTGARKLLTEDWSSAELGGLAACKVDLLPKTFGKLDKEECARRTKRDRRFSRGGGASAARECSSMMGVLDREWFSRLSSLLLRLFQGSPPSSEAPWGMTGGDMSRAGGGMSSRAESWGLDEPSPEVEWDWPMMLELAAVGCCRESYEVLSLQEPSQIKRDVGRELLRTWQSLPVRGG
jgi:hypothetical protein